MPAVSADAVAALITGHRYTWADEDELQTGIAAVLTAAGLPVRREIVIAPRCRIDLLVARVGVEVKVAGTAEAAARQLQRYAASIDLDALVLATTRAAHRVLPDRIAGCALTVAYLTRLA
jgi:hypothetical protein